MKQIKRKFFKRWESDFNLSYILKIFDNILTGLWLSLYVLHLFMNWCYDYIIEGFWKNRIGNAIIIISKEKMSKNIRVFLNKFCGHVCALCDFICLKLLTFIISSHLTWEKLKDKPELQLSFIAIMLGWSLYFIIYFMTHWFRFIIFGNPERCCDIKGAL